MAKGTLKKFPKREIEDLADEFDREFKRSQRARRQRFVQEQRGYLLDTWKAGQE